MTSQNQDTFTLEGGLDLVTQPIRVKPGYAIAAKNYESVASGYRRCRGNERFDGRPKPSEASYWVLDFDAGQTAIVAGNTVTGATSGASGVVLIDVTPVTGSWASNDATGQIVLHSVSGTFEADEDLQVSAATVAVATTASAQNGAAPANHNTYLRAAIENRRAAIAAPAGSGAVRGVFTYRGNSYCVRDNVGGTAGVLYKATATGWQAQSFGRIIHFTGAATAIMVDGETITGGTSGATATVERVVLQTGAWDGSGTGYLVLSGVSGTFSTSETVTAGSTGATVTATGADAAITLPAGGKYRVVEHNFFGTSNYRRAYFVNEVGYAHEWDGIVLCPIKVPGLSQSIDKPQHICVVGANLFLAYAGGSLQYSGTGTPTVFNTLGSAGEVGLGEDITGLKGHTKTAAIVTGRNKVAYISGTSPADFRVNDISEDSGAFTDTLEVVGQPLFLDDRGVRDMSAADTYGDWKIGSITQLVEPLLSRKKSLGILPVGVLRVRSQDQYRLYFSDRTYLSIYFGRKNPECFPLDLAFTPSVFHSGEDENGNEVLLAGSTDGMVYQMDAGTSHDGAPIDALLRTSFLNQGQPNREKRYHNGSLEVEAVGDGNTLVIASDYSYGDPQKPSGSGESLTVYGGGGFWDTSNWNEFYWSSAIQAVATFDLHGTGTNVSVSIESEATYEEPHTLSAMTINYTIRRVIRRRG